MRQTTAGNLCNQVMLELDQNTGRTASTTSNLFQVAHCIIDFARYPLMIAASIPPEELTARVGPIE